MGSKLKRSKVRVTVRPYIVNSALREEFLTYLSNAWTYFSETNHNYLLPGPHDIDNMIFMVMDLKVKVKI